ncbi:hypothetical protein [Palleronia sp. LCG004]|uniref:spike base protein, RCAP_Rcc01079 family n=1 Tax=Palleronia sp. LCG004 TaxID=3079304 RepID=UPI0029439876|nr:hypothetical protein [Palleronia sp. LCG004]WOI58424.1 hypothetical protein RVY76_18235 [Palleronia sp. LCG004]
MPDKFADLTKGLSSPPTAIMSITPDDDRDLNQPTRAINVSSAGNLRVTTTEGTTGTVFVGAGIAFPLRVVRIWATGTDAEGIKGLY